MREEAFWKTSLPFVNRCCCDLEMPNPFIALTQLVGYIIRYQIRYQISDKKGTWLVKSTSWNFLDFRHVGQLNRNGKHGSSNNTVWR